VHRTIWRKIYCQLVLTSREVDTLGFTSLTSLSKPRSEAKDFKEAGSENVMVGSPVRSTGRKALYSTEERKRRDSSKWTLVQGVLAAFQFIVFLISLTLVLRTLFTGEGAAIANASVVFKTLVLLTIMITGSLWEKDVFGQYLFAPAFFWEDVVSFVVIALHVSYVAALLTSALSLQNLMILALCAYAVYGINAAQFLWKFKMAKSDRVSIVGRGVEA
jgi:3-vinyl bacteriochlorophyllide hydratase